MMEMFGISRYLHCFVILSSFLASLLIDTFVLKDDDYFFEKSWEVTKKYNGDLKRFKYNNLKLSSSTYDDYVLLRNDTENNLQLDRKEHFTKQNATILMLVRNWELPAALKSMRSLEDRFNRRYNYDWTFLNDVPLDREFIEATTAMASGKTHYGLIPKSDWNYPSFINQTLLNNTLGLMGDEGVVYGSSLSYRNMCRFNSGFFFRQELLMNYDYYFRVEPDVEYFCDFPFDPFKVLKERKKKYGFVISLYEYEDTVRSLWETVEDFIDTHGSEKDMAIDFKKNGFTFITDKGVVGNQRLVIDSDSDYNLCHFWSNFEVGDLNFFRSDRYLKFFEHLDSTGGFYYERWGDAPVHTIAVSLLLDRNEIVHFDELGYLHKPFGTCPKSDYAMKKLRCICDKTIDFDIDIKHNSCLTRWWKNGAGKTFVRDYPSIESL